MAFNPSLAFCRCDLEEEVAGLRRMRDEVEQRLETLELDQSLHTKPSNTKTFPLHSRSDTLTSFCFENTILDL